MIEKAKAFVASTDEVWRLQRDDDPECRFFQISIAGKPGALGGSHQGTYVFSPSGQVLARINSLSPDKILDTLDRGLAEWEKLPPEARRLEDASKVRPVHRWENSYPEDGLVLLALHRDLTDDSDDTGTGSTGPDPTSPGSSRPTSRPADANGDAPRPQRWNRDHAWFHRSEVSGWIPESHQIGANRAISPTIVHRLVQFHLVDNVRGQEGPFAPSDIREASLTSTIRRVERDGTKLYLELHGRTVAESDGQWKLGDNDWKHFPNRPRSLRADLVGEATFDVTKGRFTAFTLVAIGTAEGGSGLNGRRESGRLGFLFTLAPDTPTHRVAPAFIDIYGASWIAR